MSALEGQGERRPISIQSELLCSDYFTLGAAVSDYNVFVFCCSLEVGASWP